MQIMSLRPGVRMVMVMVMVMAVAVAVAVVMPMVVRVTPAEAMAVAMDMAVNGAVGADMFVFMAGVALDLDLAFSAAAYCTHSILPSYSTSRSLTRISMPPVGCT